MRTHLRAERPERAREREELTISELLQELSAVQTGVQILFAFLLGLAFTGRFSKLDAFEVGMYVATLLLTVLTAALIATPFAVHRKTGHGGSHPRIIPVMARAAEAGRGLLALALNGAVLLVTDVVLGTVWAICITAVTASVFALLWFLLPRTLSPERPVRAARSAGPEHLATAPRPKPSRQA